MSTTTPNMSLVLPTIGVDSGLTWEQSINANSNLLDQHNHTPGYGAPIVSSSININTDFPFNNNNATLVRSINFQAQPSPISNPADIGCLYVSGVDLYYNDESGNQIQITSGGNVNATSSGISSGSATASFVSSVLVVNAAANTPADIQGASILLGNSGVTGSKYLTLSPPSAMAVNYSLTLPNLPGSTNIMALDAAGNMSAPYSVDNSTIVISSNVIQVPTGGITDTQIATQTITQDKKALMTASSTVGVGGFAISPSSGNATTTSASFLPIPNLSVTITTSGRPIYIGLQADGNMSNASYFSVPYTDSGGANFGLVQSGLGLISFVVIGGGAESGFYTSFPPGCLWTILNTVAGTYTFQAYWQAPTNALPISAAYMVLVAYEI